MDGEGSVPGTDNVFKSWRVMGRFYQRVAKRSL